MNKSFNGAGDGKGAAGTSDKGPEAPAGGRSRESRSSVPSFLTFPAHSHASSSSRSPSSPKSAHHRSGSSGHHHHAHPPPPAAQSLHSAFVPPSHHHGHHHHPHHHQVSFEETFPAPPPALLLSPSSRKQSQQQQQQLPTEPVLISPASSRAPAHSSEEIKMSSVPPLPPPPLSPGLVVGASSSHVLDTIAERNSTTSDETYHHHHHHDEGRAETRSGGVAQAADEASGTSGSSCSVPEYLLDKFHASKSFDNNNSNTTGADETKHTDNGGKPTLKLTKTVVGTHETSSLNVPAKGDGHLVSPCSLRELAIIKESCDSSISSRTTTSESYKVDDLPPLPARLATLNKPSSQAILASQLRSRKARHSIDVRALPSYLARKRQSSFGQFFSTFAPTAPKEESSSSDDPLFSEPIAPTLSLGERVAWVKSSGPEFGVVKWIGRMPQISNDWTVGVEFDNAIGSGDGTVEGRRYFVAKENFAKFLPLSDLTKVDNYAGRPRSGTMLSRMSVQLKPGQLISIQRNPNANVTHCYLNAPHHVGHDVHAPNNRHCQCHSCNHPCAHICKTRKPKGKKWTDEMAHMCHFSSKPHALMCCGGEDLPSAMMPINETGISWKHSEVMSSLRTVPTTSINHGQQHRLSSLDTANIRAGKFGLAGTSNCECSSAGSGSHGDTHSFQAHHQHHHAHQAQQHRKSPRKETTTAAAEDGNYDHGGEALLERTGSSLSISSLPSSSSLAQVVPYIGRAVLTDESDIDSETERSLEDSGRKMDKSQQNNKQGFGQLVACFFANSLRLKRPEKQKQSQQLSSSKTSRNYGGAARSGKKSRREEKIDEKVHRRHAGRHVTSNNKFGLSSTTTDGESMCDAATNSSRPSSQSFSSEVPPPPPPLRSHLAFDGLEPIDRPSALYCSISTPPKQFANPTTTISAKYLKSALEKKDCNNEPHKEESAGGGTSSGCSSVALSFPGPSTSAGYSGGVAGPSGNRPGTSASSERADSNSERRVGSTNPSSSENAASPRRRRNKGPAPKPPRSLATTTHSSCSPVSASNTSCPSSLPQSPSNSSLVTSCSSGLSKKPALVTSSTSAANKIWPKRTSSLTRNDQPEASLEDDHLLLVVDDHKLQNTKNIRAEAIYETPVKIDDIPPDLPTKTFDAKKVFGCGVDPQTKKLEAANVRGGVADLFSMPFARYTCCAYHWKEYLAYISATVMASGDDLLAEMMNAKLAVNNEETKCCGNDRTEARKNNSGLVQALLSPQHSERYSKISASCPCCQEEDNDSEANKAHNQGSSEMVRALSDGSLTNTSATTVIETNKCGDTDNEPQPLLSDVFVQTSFTETSRSTLPLTQRRYKHRQTHSCRCRNGGKWKRSSHCEDGDHGGHHHHHHHHHRPRHDHECCSSSALAPKLWLASSNSERSLSSLSSSSTSSVVSNEPVAGGSLLAASALHNMLASTGCISPFGDAPPPPSGGCKQLDNTFGPSKESVLFGRSPTNIERLFASSENSIGYANNANLLLSSTTSVAGEHNEPDLFGKMNNGKLPSQVWPRDEMQIKCLMSELQTAIANGNHHRASIIAKELAIKKANCSLLAKIANDQTSSPIVTYLYVEDRNSHRGPIPFQVYPAMSVNMLKLKVEKEFNIASELQKWVLGRTIANDMNASLASHGIISSGCPIFLYVVHNLPENTSNVNDKQQVTKFMNKPNGNMSRNNTNREDDDGDDVYETLRPDSIGPLFDKINDQKPVPVKACNVKSGQPITYIQNPMASLNLNCDSVNFFEPDDNKFASSTQPPELVQIVNNIATTTAQSNLIKNYYYHEGEVPFQNDLVFEGLAIASTDLLPRVDEVDEEELDDDDDDEDDDDDDEDVITTKDMNGAGLAKMAEKDNQSKQQLSCTTTATYHKLIELEDVKCVINVESFECPVCFGHFKSGEGVVLRECLHTFCRECLRSTIEYSEEIRITCPFRDDLYSCDACLQEREVKELASGDVFERYLTRGVTVAEKNMEKAYHCKTADCPGWCVYEDNVNVFHCPVCDHSNCLNCQAIHPGVSCRQYRQEVQFNADESEDTTKTRNFLADMIKRDEALRCPRCQVVVTKKWGCDWVKCSMCHTEICWITKGFRWGPKGKGDTSSGCRCMLNGVKCHPQCKYCH